VAADAAAAAAEEEDEDEEEQAADGSSKSLDVGMTTLAGRDKGLDNLPQRYTPESDGRHEHDHFKN
jgi:hypothetical protein